MHKATKTNKSKATPHSNQAINKKGKQKMNSTTTMTSNIIEPVTMSEVLELASWDRQRSNDELRSFIARRESITANTQE